MAERRTDQGDPATAIRAAVVEDEVAPLTPAEMALAGGTVADEAGAADRVDWRFPAVDVVRDGKDRPVWCLATGAAIFSQHPHWRDALAYNEFTGRYMLLRPIVGAPPEPGFQPRELRDQDVSAAVVWLNRSGFPNAARSVADEAMRAAADLSVINPLRHYLEDLRWDGQSRLASWLANYAGADSDDYTAEAGLRWMISAVARALSPGCKAEGVLVLEGRQGSGKSTLFRLLASAAYFGDALTDFASKDSSIYLRGRWIIELAELAALSRAEAESVKSFISRQEERYRPPYGRAEVVEPRRCVFAGSTNRSDYLRDATGNRRFWPVRTGEIDLAGIERDRDQLWAEAVARYQRGERWWLAGDMERAAALVQAERAEDDPWRGAVARYCEGKRAVAVKTILGEAIGVELDRMGRADTLRVAGLLAELGFVRDGQFTAGPEKGLARFVPREGGR